jgi:hypothetical protein
MEPLETAIQLIAILSGEDYSEVSKLSLDSIRKAYAALSFIDSMDFPDKIEEYLEFDGVKYTAKLDIRKITAGPVHRPERLYKGQGCHVQHSQHHGGPVYP